MKKKEYIEPQYIKNSKGKVTHVYLPIDDYEIIQKRLKKWEQIQKKEGVRWVKVSPVKKKSTKKK